MKKFIEAHLWAEKNKKIIYPLLILALFALSTIACDCMDTGGCTGCASPGSCMP